MNFGTANIRYIGIYCILLILLYVIMMVSTDYFYSVAVYIALYITKLAGIAYILAFTGYLWFTKQLSFKKLFPILLIILTLLIITLNPLKKSPDATTNASLTFVRST